MNILETFLILFESNADEVDTGAKKAKKTTDDLDDSIKRTNVSADQLGQKFLQTMKQAIGAFVAFQTIGSAISGFNATIDYADNLNRASQALDISVESLDVWGRAVKMAGGSTEGFIGSIKTLSSAMSQMDVTGKSRVAPFFKEIGVAMTDASGKARPALELFPEIADAFEKMGKQQSIGFGRKLGLDDGTIMLLQKGRREVDALIARQRELGVINAEDAKVAAAYKDSIDELSFAWRAFASKLAGDVLPIFTWVIEKFTAFGVWAQNHEGFLYGFFGAIAGIMAVFAANALIAAAAITVLGLPFYVVAAAVAALAVAFGLLWDDFKKWTENPDLSSLNRFWEFMTTDHIGPAWEAFKSVLSSIWDILKNIGGVIGSVVSGIGSVLSFGDDAYKAARMKMSPTAQNDALMGVAQDQLALAGSTPIGSQSSNSIMSTNRSSNQSVSIGEVNVHTQATDGPGMAASAGQSLKSEMRQALSNADDGIRG